MGKTQKNETRRNFSVLARYAVVILAMLAAAGLIIYKLVGTTVIDAEKWNERARKEFSEVVMIQPQRGDILAADGSVLATNMQYHTVRIDFTSGPFKEEKLKMALDSLVDSLATYFPVKSRSQWKADFLEQLEKPKAKRNKAYKLLDGISYADYVKLRTFPFLRLPNKYHCGIVLETHERRVNPYGRMARRSIGIVSQTENDPERHGRWGLERSLDSLLYGKPGRAKKIPLTKRIDTWTEVAPVPGYNITTTIDINLQEMVENELANGLDYCGAEWGVAVLMEVKTGDIKAIANLEINPSGTGYIEALNRAVQGYEPGSVVKTLSMLIALEDGIVKGPDDIVETGARWAYDGGNAITDTHISASKTAMEVISHSSNIGMARIITSRYGSNPGTFYTRLKSLGIFEPMNSGIAGELCPRIDSLPSNHVGRIALSRMSYGYTTEFSPLWTLSIYNAIANGGAYVRPRLVTRLSGNGVDSVIPPSYIRERICSERNAQILRDMLADVILNSQGTGRALRSDLVKLAGKTGTCYVIENGQYNKSAKRLAFCGFFPADDPKYSCVVLVCKPTRNAFGAAGTSGNIFRTIAHKLYARGMLDNSSDYTAKTTEGTVPTLFAALDPERNGVIRRLFNISGTQSSLRQPKAATGPTVPDVRGYGIRDAVRVLESAGFNVSTTGAGFVYAQVPEPGARLPKGAKVSLRLNP